jgi:menaquinone-dependent protoporphyrinogen oxidase
MGGVLVVYASTHGHTEKIAGRIGDAIRQEGVEADVRDVKDAADADPADYDGVIVAASLHGGSHQREIGDWVTANGASLASLRTAFVSVSLTAAEDTEEAREATQRCIDDFLKQTDWAPGPTMPIAGALQYREYDVFTRTLMRNDAPRRPPHGRIPRLRLHGLGHRRRTR